MMFHYAHIDMIEYDPDRWWFGIYILMLSRRGSSRRKMEDVQEHTNDEDYRRISRRW